MDQRQDILSFDFEWNQYPLEEYNSPWPYFHNIKRVQRLVGKTFQYEDAIKDHWMNATDYYDVCIRDYCRMTLYLEESALKINISLKIIQKDTKDLINPLFNRDKIGDRPIMNAKINKEEKSNINHRARLVIKFTKD